MNTATSKLSVSSENYYTVTNITEEWHYLSPQEGIPARCILLALTICAPKATRCQHWWGRPKVNEFEQVSGDGHQMSLSGGAGAGGQMCNGHIEPPCRQTDTQEWKHNLPTTSLSGSKYLGQVPTWICTRVTGTKLANLLKQTKVISKLDCQRQYHSFMLKC